MFKHSLISPSKTKQILTGPPSFSPQTCSGIKHLRRKARNETRTLWFTTAAGVRREKRFPRAFRVLFPESMNYFLNRTARTVRGSLTPALSVPLIKGAKSAAWKLTAFRLPKLWPVLIGVVVCEQDYVAKRVNNWNCPISDRCFRNNENIPLFVLFVYNSSCNF